jgi:hypothetical protein
MNEKTIELIRKDKIISIEMNKVVICVIDTTKRKINGKDLFNKLNICKNDNFILIDCLNSDDIDNIDDFVLKNAYEFISLLVNRINSSLKEVNTQYDELFFSEN